VKMIDLDVLVLAAGKSERIRSIADGLPKPLLKVGGRSVLEQNLRRLAKQGIGQAWINVHYRPEAIREAIGDGAQLGLKVRYSMEAEILGTAGAARHLLSHWTGRLLVVYGDNLLSFDLQRLASVHRESGAPVTIGLFDRRISAHTGIAGGRVTVDDERRITSFRELGDQGGPAEGLVNAGVYLIERDILARIPPDTFFDFARDLFPALIAEGLPLNAYVFGPEEYCLGIDTPEHFSAAQKLFNARAIRFQ